MKKLTLYTVTSTLLMFFGTATQAAVIKCKSATGNFGSSNYSDTFNMDASIGADYEQYIMLTKVASAAPVGSGIFCEGGTAPAYHLGVSVTPTLSYTPEVIPGRTVGGNPMFKTSVPGIGYVIRYNINGRPWISGQESDAGNDIYSSTMGTTVPPGSPVQISGGKMYAAFEFYRLGNGEFASGTIDLSTLPKITFTATSPSKGMKPLRSGDTVTGFPINFGSLRVNGKINITSSTCNITAPDITIPLGKNEVSKFTGINSATDWVKSSINLSGCSNFSKGFNSSYWNTNDSAGVIQRPSSSFSIANIQVRATAFDIDKGILKIDSSKNAATGVGIQLSSSEDLTPIKLNYPVKLTAPTSSNFTIPLAARYIQTAEKVTPGIANAKATYTITYR